MTRQRKEEIVRKVFYANFSSIPRFNDIEDAFYVGRMVGQMQRQLEIELSSEVETQESEVQE